MSLVLTLCCDVVGSNGVDCPSKIHGTEEINLTEPYPRDFVSMRVLGHLQLNYGEGLVEDLHAAALSAGWQWDGHKWKCGLHANPGTATELAEMIAHSMDL